MSPYSHTNSMFKSVSYRFMDCIVDPGDTWDGFVGIWIVLLTHAHFDHIYGLNALLEISPAAKIYTNEVGKVMLLDSRKNLSYYHGTPFTFGHPEAITVIKDGETVDLGNGQVATAMFTPGHNPSCITWIVGDSIFTGDSYIPGIKTVTNLPRGNRKEAVKSECLIIELSNTRKVYPGHNISK